MPPPTSQREAPTDPSVPCMLCGATGISPAQMQRHIEFFHAKPVSVSGEKSSGISSHSCDLCGFTASGESQLRSHKKDDNCGYKYECLLCPSRFPTVTGVETHMLKSHQDEECEQSGSVGAKDMSIREKVTDGDRHRLKSASESNGGVSQTYCIAEQSGSRTYQQRPPAPVWGREVDGGASSSTLSNTSLRLSDRPFGDTAEESTEVEKEGSVEVDLTEDMDMDDEESNLLEILGSTRNRQPANTSSSRTKHEHPPAANLQTGARPKVMANNKPTTASSDKVKENKMFNNGSNVLNQDVSVGNEEEGLSLKKGIKGTEIEVASGTMKENSDTQEKNSGMKQEANSGLTYTCPLCAFETSSSSEIQRHVDREHRMEEGDDEGWGEEGEDDSSALHLLYTCPFCNGGFDTPGSLSAHINNEHPDGEGGGGGSSSVDQYPAAMDHQPVGGRLCECPVCGHELEDGNELTLSLHVATHFQSSPCGSSQVQADRDRQMAMRMQEEEKKKQLEDARKFQKIQTQFGMDETMTARQQFDKDLERAVSKGRITTSQFHMQKVVQAQASSSGVDDGSTRVSGVLEKLRSYYDSKGCPRTVARALLSNSTHHYSSSYGDKGWGCGYRNFQMMLSCLTGDPTYLQVIFNGRALVPSVKKIQQLIEAAWGRGFDPPGCEQLGGKLVNTRKWIGATEIVATLSSLKTKCKLLDFGEPSGPNNTHPAMLEWVRGYFKSDKPFKPPLYLQHQGHSRSIVGVEELRDGGVNLLLFDPGVAQGRMTQFLGGRIDYKLMQTVRKTSNAFRAKQYQIVAVCGVMEEREMERSKTLCSTKLS